MKNGFDILAAGDPLSHVVQHELFTVPGTDFAVSNHILMMFLAAVLLVVILPQAARQRSMVPTGIRNFFEAICAFIRDEVARPVLGGMTDRYIVFIWNTFFFILFCNLLGMIPLDGIVYLVSGMQLQHIGGTATANIWVTGALSVVAFFMIHISGIREQGVLTYLKNFIPHVPWPLVPVMYILEFIGALVKPFALAIRLFANMLAGHTVLGALIGLVFMSSKLAIMAPTAVATVAGCAAISLLELFVAFLQAYIFTYLMTMFIGAAVHPEH